MHEKLKTGEFPLYLAALKDKPLMIRLLVSRGANIHEPTRKGDTAMHGACSHMLERNILTLLDLGANINMKNNDGSTPFSLMVHDRLSPAIKTIIKQFAKLMSVHSSVNEMDLEILKRFPDLKKFYDDCFKEIERMKIEEFHGASFYCIFLKSEKQLSSLVRNSELVADFKLRNCESLFPLYSNDLNFAFEKALKRMTVTRAIEQRVSSVFSDVLPDTVTREIVNYLIRF